MNLHPDQTNKRLDILVLDDNAEWRYLMKSMLEAELGVPVSLASTGQEALDILHSRPFDVVISDLCMPEMNGIQFLDLARLLRPNTRVIIMSADRAALMPEVLMARGAFAVIPKDFIILKLVNVLRNLDSEQDSGAG